MNEQAPAALESAGGLADLASFLSDTPEEESTEETEAQLAEAETLGNEDTSDEANSEQTDEESADSEEEPVDEEETAPATKITFKVKGEDGVEETVEATPEELASSYMRQKDYTRKTQALAERESEAVKILTQRHEEMRSQYLSQAEVTRTAIVNMAGIKTEQEMAQLANSDPASWVAEQQRQRQISAYLNQLDQQINGEKQQAELQRSQQFQQHLQQQYQKAWDDLSKEGIDKPKLQKIYGDTSKHYGFSNEELGNVYDSRLVRMMKDAAAYRDLQAQKSVVTKKAQDAPRMPSRQNAPAQERIDKALDSKFKSGRAKLQDLAAYLR
jgi:hypothetical protein